MPYPHRIPFSTDQIDIIIKQYQAGILMADICARYKTGGKHIRKVLKEAGVVPRDNNVYKRNIKARNSKIAEEYSRGVLVGDIAQSHKVSRDTIRRVARKMGLPPRGVEWCHACRAPFVPRVDRDTLNRHYTIERMSAQAIAERYGVSDSTVWNWLNCYVIPPISAKVRAAERPCYGHPSWKGGLTPFRTLLTTRLLPWRKEVLKRDQYRCQHCDSKRELEVHHTKPLRHITREFKEAFPNVDISTPAGLDFAIKTVVSMHSVEMGICLCRECHEDVDSWRNRFKPETAVP